MKTIYMNSPQATRIIQLKNDTFWTSFQTSRKRFRKLQEAMWLTVINEIFKFLSHLDPFGQEDYL